ncbi:MAG TPA: ATP-binding protein [Candidatus Eisenbacteria bacterium]|nr:ATP-binding protein [Candidatus Eisenbacteria bacterium]
MSITAIEICDFRAFPGPATFTINVGGRNLLMHGENGSGKSSLFRAVLELLNLDPRAKPFTDYRNIFSDPDLAAGHVTLRFKDGTSAVWPIHGERPLKDPRIGALAIRTAGIDYQAMLQTNFVHSGDKVNLFNIAVEVLLKHCQVVTSGGRTTTIGRLWQNVQNSKPRTHHAGNLRRADASVSEFNHGLAQILAALTSNVQSLLADFPGCAFEVKFDFPGVVYDRRKRVYAQTDLNLELLHKGAKIARHHHFLNEARLSAVALAIYFGSLLTTIPAAPPGAADDLRLLLLDDVVIGLDMANREPVLHILEQRFNNWQVLLLTHDTIWFEFIRRRERETHNWHLGELLRGTSPEGLDVPVYTDEGEGSDHLISRAKRYLGSGDKRAAAAYARMAFESRLKHYCEKRGVAVRYSTDPDKMKSEWFLTAIKEKAVAEGKTAHYQRIFQDIEAYRGTVLNPLVHPDPVALTREDVEGAIKAVEALAGLK